MTRFIPIMLLIACTSGTNESHSGDTEQGPLVGTVGIYGFNDTIYIHDAEGKAIDVVVVPESNYLEVDNFPDGGGLSHYFHGAGYPDRIEYFQNVSIGDQISFGFGGTRDNGETAGELTLIADYRPEYSTQVYFAPGHEAYGSSISSNRHIHQAIPIGSDSVDQSGQILVTAIAYAEQTGFDVMETTVQFTDGAAEVNFYPNAEGKSVFHKVTNTADENLSIQVNTMAVRDGTPIPTPQIPITPRLTAPGETFEAETQYSTIGVDRIYTRVTTITDRYERVLNRVQRVEASPEPILTQASDPRLVTFDGDIDDETGLVHYEVTHDGSCGDHVVGNRIRLKRSYDADSPTEGGQRQLEIDLFSYSENTLHLPTYEGFAEVPEGLTTEHERMYIREVQTVVGDQQLAEGSRGFYRLKHLRGQILHYDGPGFCDYVQQL